MQSPSSGLQQIGDLVRYWLHYDTMLADLNRQTKTVRDTRNNYEHQVLRGLQAAGMKHPVIQIVGGRITVSEEKHTTPLNFKTLETALHEYYMQRPGVRDETADILKFIKASRTTEVVPCLKRTMTGAPVPPPPALPPTGGLKG